MKNLPDRIYLIFGKITNEEFRVADFDECAEVTWCKDKVFEHDQEYIRKDAIWKDAQGEDLPEYERNVIGITEDDGELCQVVYVHRPDPKGWCGKSLTDGKVEHYTPKTYDKGGWNIPDVKYWLDLPLPKEGGEG